MTHFAKKNNAESTIADNPLSNVATTLNVASGQGALFGSVFPFLLTIYDAGTYPNPKDDANMEIVKCTARTDDALTIVRAQEGTSAVQHAQGQKVIMAITAALLNEMVTQDGAQVYAADAGSSDAYAITLSPIPAAYTAGMVIRFKANTANTGACTLNANSLGAKAIKKNYNTDLADNDIKAGQLVAVIYDSTNDAFQMLSQLGNASSGGGGATKMFWTESFEYLLNTGDYNNRFRAGALSSGGTAKISYGGVQLAATASAGRQAIVGTIIGNSNLTESVYNKSPEFYTLAQLSDEISTNFVSYVIFGAQGISNRPDASGNYTTKHFGFILDKDVLYASNANGSSQTKTDISAGITMSNRNTFRAVQDGSADIKFYVNGTLVATHTTNLPSATLAGGSVWMIGIENDNAVSTVRSISCMPLTYGWNL